MNHSIRLSRIRHPRATIWALALMAVVFLAFGAWAGTTQPSANRLAAHAEHDLTEVSARVGEL